MKTLQSPENYVPFTTILKKRKDDFGKNTHGIWNGKTSAYGEDFLYDDEVVYRFGGVYDLSEQGIEGLLTLPAPIGAVS